MSKYFAILLLTLLCTFCQCTSQHEADDEGRDYPSEEAFTLIDSCMSLMKSDPQRSHHMLDSLQVAELACSSRSVVSACINNITGRSFRQWLSDYRLSLFAKKLKENPDDPIDIIVMRCGYKEQSTFRRQFKAAYGMTPTEYRRQLVQGIDPESEDPNIPKSEKTNS